MRWRHALGVALAALGPLLVAGCAGDEPYAGPCPAVFLLEEARTTAVYRPGGGSDLSDVAFWLELSDLKSACGFREGLLAGVIDIEGSVVVRAEKGPEAIANAVTFEIFSTLVNRDGAVLRKALFPGLVRFAAGQSRAATVIAFESGVALLEEHSGDDYVVFVGFQSPARLKAAP
ncbi:MAG TPA: hypothetical protein VJN41_07045 [Alphaproteobacteria bacterium]|nr:hypothetical protein [Alphaproteobacteria bacterium]